MCAEYRITEKDKEIGALIYEYIKSVPGLHKSDIAKLVVKDNAHFYRLLNGKHRWTREIIDKVVAALSRYGVVVSPYELLGEGVRIPVVAEVSAGKALVWMEGNHPSGNGFDYIYARDIPGISEKMAAECYAVRVRGDSMIPLLKNGELLIVNPDSREEIVNGDHVVFTDTDRNSYIKWVSFENGLLVLNSFNPIFQPRCFKPSDAVLMDKIIVIIKS
ncbi:MAG: helix-turn-helix transcriptional regulator [Desulfosarcina sp.]|nr:helix-turn-helix transcriptional regulator [Desulfosarcina sp.]